jgi:hypothetical protein
MERPLMVAAVAAVVLCPARPVRGQPYRDTLILPASQLYERMLKYADDKDYEKVSRSLQVARPVTEALKAKFGSDPEGDIRDGLERKDLDRVRRGLHRLILLDMRDLIGLALTAESPEKSSTKFRGAYIDYLMLSTGVQARDFNADQKIRNAFRRAVLRSTREQMQEARDEIEREVARVFAEAPAKR